VIFLYPVSELLWLSVVGRDGQLSLAAFKDVWDTPLYWRVMFITLEISAWTAFISIIAAYPVAYLIATTKSATAVVLFILVLVPFWTSFLVRSFAWMIVLGQRGVVNSLLVGLEYPGAPVKLIYTFSAVVIAMVHSMMPLAILTMLAVMKTVNPVFEMAAKTLGARGGESFWRIYFPLSLPGVAASGLLVLVTSLGFFIVPAMLGGPRQTMITQILIYAIQDLLNWQLAGVLSVLLLVATAIVFVVYDRLLGFSSLSGELSPMGKVTGRRSALRTLGLWVVALTGRMCSLPSELLERLPSRLSRRRSVGSRLTLGAIALLLILFLVLPSLIVVPVALNSGEFTTFPPEGYSLRWFQEYIKSPVWLSATERSIVVALFTGVLATIIGGAAAYVLAFSEIYGRAVILLLIMLPMIIPRMIFAVGLFRLYSDVGLVGSLIGLILGHTAIALPYVLITMLAVFKTYDIRMDQAAWTLGANRWQSLRYIMGPQVYDGVIASFLFAFVTSFDDLTVSLFVSGGLTSTLPRQMWSSIFLEVRPILASASTIVLILVTSFVLIGEMLRRRASR
jgi:ABC-type spermidine/putrescine transport system permease subunit I